MDIMNRFMSETIETCADVAQLHSLRTIENDYQRGYNDAAMEIAKQIRELNKGKV